MKAKTTGQYLMELRERSGLTLAEVAQRAGYKGPSSVQAMFNADYDVRPLGMAVGDKLWRAFDGTGDPPIEYSDIYFLCSGTKHMLDRMEADRQSGLVGQGAWPWQTRGSPLSPPNELDPAPPISAQVGSVRSKDVPVFGTVLAADLVFGEDGQTDAVEQTVFEMGDTITYAQRPAGIHPGSKAYALFVSGSSMEPRYRPGDPIFIDPKRPPAIGDDVVVQLLAPHDEEQEIIAGLIKTLVKRTGAYLELEQYQPNIRFRVPVERVAQLHRVIPLSELFGI